MASRPTLRSKPPQNRKELEQLLAKNNELNLNDTVIHLAVSYELDSLLHEIINETKQEDRLTIYMKRNRFGFTPLDQAVYQNNKSISDYILRSLENDEQRMGLLQSENKRGCTALHRAVYMKDEELLRQLLKSVRADRRMALVLTTDSQGSSFFLQSLSSADSAAFKCILTSLTEEQTIDADKSLKIKHEVLAWKDSLGNTILHNIVMIGNVELLQFVMSGEQPRDIRTLLMLQDSDGRTLLHVAVENANTTMVKNILELLQLEQMRFDLLWAVDNRLQTALHYAVRSDNNDVLDMILNAVDEHNFIMLLGQEDITKKKVMQEAIRVSNTNAIARLAKFCSSKELLAVAARRDRDSHLYNRNVDYTHSRHPPPSASIVRPVEVEGQDDEEKSMCIGMVSPSDDTKLKLPQINKLKTRDDDTSDMTGHHQPVETETLGAACFSNDGYIQNEYTPVSDRDAKVMNNPILLEERTLLAENQISDSKGAQAIDSSSSTQGEAMDVVQMGTLKSGYEAVDDSTMYPCAQDASEIDEETSTMLAQPGENESVTFRTLQGPGTLHE